MKALLALAALALLGAGIGACGGVSRGTPTAGPVATPAGHSSNPPSTHGYLNDGDAEKIDDGDHDERSADHEDTDADSADEYGTEHGNGGYRDSDDRRILTYGHAARAAERHAVAAVVKRYFAAAAAENGATGCSLMALTFSSGVAESYGENPGPAYLRGGKTCQAVMHLLFEHFHAQLIGTIGVSGVRVEGDRALALIGSTTISAGDISLERSGGAWKIDGLIGSALP